MLYVVVPRFECRNSLKLHRLQMISLVLGKNEYQFSRNTAFEKNELLIFPPCGFHSSAGTDSQTTQAVVFCLFVQCTVV